MGAYASRPGGEGEVAVIEWLDPRGTVEAEVWGGSTEGFVIGEDNFDGTWTYICILDGEAKVCEE